MRKFLCLALGCLALSSCGGSAAPQPAASLLISPPVNKAPAVSKANENQSAKVGTAFTYDATQTGNVFKDPDGDDLTLTVTFDPDDNGLSASEGTITGTPSYPGKVNVTVTASDGKAQTSDSFVINVAADVNMSASIKHFGQAVLLNGANLAWSENRFYNRDIGTPEANFPVFKERFKTIADAGGNSARIWLHTNGIVSPNTDQDGVVLGLSRELSDEAVVQQLITILDLAWEQGVLVNFTLFSFDMMCIQGERYDKMLNTHYQTYFDKALRPMVEGAKDHPAMFAWEIFNESNGMATGKSFFHAYPDVCSNGIEQSEYSLQRFINLAAAVIHKLDPNVKVTSSVAHPGEVWNYTNDILTQQDFSDPNGILDFYQVHWYEAGYNPFVKPRDEYDLDRPIVIGEFTYRDDQDSGTPAQDLGKKIFENGYAGAWMWDMAQVPLADVQSVIRGASDYSPAIDKAAIESCIKNKSTECYKNWR